MITFSSYLIIVIPSILDHQYAKLTAWYGILIDSAILKSTIFDDFVDLMERRTRKSQIGGQKNRTKVTWGNVRADKSYLGNARADKIISGNFGRTDRKSPTGTFVKSTEFGKINRIW